MTCNLIKIGTSKGIRIPATLLKALDNPESFELEYNETKIVLIPEEKKEPRKGWEKAFKEAAKHGEDELLIHDGIDIDLEVIDEI